MSKEEELKDDIKKIKDVVVLGETKGGKQLMDGLTKDIISSIENLTDNRATLTLQEFVSLASDIKTKLDVVRVITRAKKNDQFLQTELKEALEE